MSLTKMAPVKKLLLDDSKEDCAIGWVDGDNLEFLGNAK
jgi:hypothetical protein